MNRYKQYLLTIPLLSLLSLTLNLYHADNVAALSVAFETDGDSIVVKDATFTSKGIDTGGGDIYFEPTGDSDSVYKSWSDTFNSSCEVTAYILDTSTGGSTGTLSAEYTVSSPPKECTDLIPVTSTDIGTSDGFGGDLADDTEEEDTAVTTCEIDGIGWLICPVMKFGANVVDQSYGILEDQLLQTQPLKVNDTSDPMYVAWSAMRDLANAAFILAFLVIIASHATSIGISNYGIKKMLPKLIVAAILVNVSYWISAIAVDLSNISGVSMRSVFGSEGLVPPESIGTTDTGVLSSGNTWTDITVGILAFAGSVYLFLSALAPVLIGALAAVLTVVLVLVLRQALIILLIVISPLAFVALLLPNTESLFKKWKSLFITMLLMYPIIAGIVGASSLASDVVMTSAGDDDTLVKIMGAGISIIPLFLTPIVMKTAGGVLNRFAGMVNNTDKGMFDRMRKGVDGARDAQKDRRRGARTNRAMGVLNGEKNGRIRGLVLGKQGSRRRGSAAVVASMGTSYRINRDKKRGFNKTMANDSEEEYFAKRAITEEGFAEKMVGGGNDEKSARKATSLKASATSTVGKIEDEAMAAQVKLIKAQVDPTRQMAAAVDNFIEASMAGDVTRARAAQQILMTSGAPGLAKLSESINFLEGKGKIEKDDSKGIAERSQLSANVFDSSPQGRSLRSELRQDVNSAGLKAKDNVLASWSYTDSNIEDIRRNQKTYTGLSDRELIGQSDDNIKAAVASNAISAERAQRLLDNDTLGSDFTVAKREIIEGVAQGVSTNTTTATPAAAPTHTNTAPTPQNYTRGYSAEDIQQMGPQAVQQIIDVSAGGNVSNLSDGDLAKLILATKSQPGFESINEVITSERDNRRGYSQPTSMTDQMRAANIATAPIPPAPPTNPTPQAQQASGTLTIDHADIQNTTVTTPRQSQPQIIVGEGYGSSDPTDVSAFTNAPRQSQSTPPLPDFQSNYRPASPPPPINPGNTPPPPPPPTNPTNPE